MASTEGTAILQKWAGLVDGLVETFRSRRSEPGLFEVMTSAVNIMQDRITRSRLAIDPPDLVLRPDAVQQTVSIYPIMLQVQEQLAALQQQVTDMTAQQQPGPAGFELK